MIYDGMFGPAFPLRQAAVLAGVNLWTLRMWLQQGALRLLGGDRLEEGGRRERWVSAATVVSFAIADRAVIIERGVVRYEGDFRVLSGDTTLAARYLAA